MKNKTRYTLSEAAAQLKDGLITSNPTFVQFLGICPTLATTTSVKNGLGMGLTATAVLALSNLAISLLRKFIPKEVRIACYILIFSSLSTAAELLIRAYLPALDKSLGVFIPLIVVNCIIYARAEAFAARNPPLPSLVDGLSMGLGFTLSLTVIAAVRELLGSGTILGFDVFRGVISPIQIFIMPSGAFITLGCLLAAVKWFGSLPKKKDGAAPAAPGETPPPAGSPEPTAFEGGAQKTGEEARIS